MFNRIGMMGILLGAVFAAPDSFADEQRTDFDIDDDGLIEINDLQDLNNIRNHVGGTALYGQDKGCPESGCIGFELTTDLDFDTNQDGNLDEKDEYWNQGEGWERIGGPEDSFNATFEGNNHHISNLFIKQPSLLEVGLFGWTSGATIRNLHLVKSSLNVEGHTNVGGLVGFAIGTQISNCSSDVSIKAESVAGGLVGRSQSSLIEYSYSTSDIDSSDTSISSSVGGLVGSSDGGEIIASYASGNVSASIFGAGGLLGYGKNGAKIIASYATGDVSAPESTGGLIGQAEDMYIEASFSTGSVSGDALTGGLIGSTDNTRVINSYWATDTSGQEYSADGSGVSLEQLKCPTKVNDNNCSVRTLFQGWDQLENDDGIPYWSFGSNEQLPSLNDKKSNAEKTLSGGSVNSFTLMMLLFTLSIVRSFENRRGREGTS